MTDILNEAHKEYGADQITALEGLMAVRKRPAMYIGGVGKPGFHHLLWEIVDNSIDEAMGGHCDKIEVTLNPDNSVTVSDNGRGIPVEPQKNGAYKGMPTVEMVLTVLHAGGKFGQGGYSYSGGLHGVGISVVNALSKWTRVQVDKAGKSHSIEFGQVVTTDNGVATEHPGAVTSELDVIGKSTSTGTTVTFLPDDDIFTHNKWDYELIQRRVQNTAFLNAGLSMILNDERDPEQKTSEEFHYPNGLRDFMDYVTESRLDALAFSKDISRDEVTTSLPEPIMLEGSREGIGEWSVCLQWFPDHAYHVYSYANGIETSDGGTHVDGFQLVLTQIMNRWARQSHVQILSEKEPNLEATDVRSGVGVILTVKVPEPQFQGQTKSRLGNDDVKTMVRTGVYDALWNWMEDNPVATNEVVHQAVSEMRLRKKLADAADRERQNSEKRGSEPQDKHIPSKLYECETKDRSLAELFICEGDSAAGSAILGRDRATQAILPIRGKILNVLVSDDGRIYNNNEVKDIIASMGAGSEDLFNLDKRRYERVVILADADDDGHHIALLLITLFHTLMRPYVEAGHLYVARTPLFSTTIRDEKHYMYSVDERDEMAEKHPNAAFTRFKGLGEMNDDELAETALDPTTRSLVRLTVEDTEELAETTWNLMGNDASIKWDILSRTEVSLADAQSA